MQILAAVVQSWGRGVWGACAKGCGMGCGHWFWLARGRQVNRWLRKAPWQSETQSCPSDPFLCYRQLLAILQLRFLITWRIRLDCGITGSPIFLTHLTPHRPKCKGYVYTTKLNRPLRAYGSAQFAFMHLCCFYSQNRSHPSCYGELSLSVHTIPQIIRLYRLGVARVPTLPKSIRAFKYYSWSCASSQICSLALFNLLI